MQKLVFVHSRGAKASHECGSACKSGQALDNRECLEQKKGSTPESHIVDQTTNRSPSVDLVAQVYLVVTVGTRDTLTKKCSAARLQKSAVYKATLRRAGLKNDKSGTYATPRILCCGGERKLRFPSDVFEPVHFVTESFATLLPTLLGRSCSGVEHNL
jgi:hypothetical protein